MQKFDLGKIVATSGLLAELERSGESPAEFLRRHVSGDWGECCKADRAENELSLKEGFRIFSVYKTKLDVKIWIITEADRSSTCCLLPSDY